jgi:hypothetical protein
VADRSNQAPARCSSSIDTPGAGARTSARCRSSWAPRRNHDDDPHPRPPVRCSRRPKSTRREIAPACRLSRNWQWAVARPALRDTRPRCDLLRYTPFPHSFTALPSFPSHSASCSIAGRPKSARRSLLRGLDEVQVGRTEARTLRVLRVRREGSKCIHDRALLARPIEKAATRCNRKLFHARLVNRCRSRIQPLPFRREL